MKCKFEPGQCDLGCLKYPMCSHYYIENQLTEMHSQIGNIYTAITKLMLKEKMNEENIEKAIALVNDYFQNSDSIQNTFEPEAVNEEDN